MADGGEATTVAQTTVTKSPAKRSRSKPRSAKRSTAKRTTARRTRSEFGSRRYRLKPSKGELATAGPDGQVWQPIACGDHRSVRVRETAANDAGTTADGFQPDCEACQEQAQATAMHALQQSTV